MFIKIIISNLIVVSLFACSSNQTTQTIPKHSIEKTETTSVLFKGKTNLLQFENLHGNIKKLTLTTYLARTKNRSIEKIALGTKYITSFDEYGNGVERSFYNSNNRLQSKTRFEHDENHNCIASKEMTSSNELLKQNKYVYDAEQNLTEIQTKNAKLKPDYKTRYVYNTNRLLSEELKFNASQKQERRITYQYNTRQALVQSKFYSESNTLNIVCDYSYVHFDAQGNWTSRTVKTNKGGFFLEEQEIEYYAK